jgi:hypothetical protein
MGSTFNLQKHGLGLITQPTVTLLDFLFHSPVGKEDILEKSLPRGVSLRGIFHEFEPTFVPTAGLSTRERKYPRHESGPKPAHM